MISKLDKVEFGDFQTPTGLAEDILIFLAGQGLNPSVIVEPNCGLGSFILAAKRTFPRAGIFAFDINAGYIERLKQLWGEENAANIQVRKQDFYKMNWDEFFQKQEGEILVIGNPPWVTSSALGALGRGNMPRKSNIMNHKGLEAKTGKANFDISEWMLIRLLDSINNRRGCMAMLCKMASARKVLLYAWRNRLSIGNCSMHLINAKAHFNASVDACLLLIHSGLVNQPCTASVYGSLSFKNNLATIGLYGGKLIADLETYLKTCDIDGASHYKWRSGVKHDASKIMEFTKDGNYLRNGLGEKVHLENDYIYPLLKSSDIANGRLKPSRLILMTQRQVSDDTAKIGEAAPLTWAYLLNHKLQLQRRKSPIYINRPDFSIFGVGNYTFSPWKVSVSGLYKKIRFRVVGSIEDKPIMLDDTCYFIPCRSKREAQFMCDLLNSDLCLRFITSLIFMDAKRPINCDILNRIDLNKLAKKLGIAEEGTRYLQSAQYFEKRQQMFVYEKNIVHQEKS